MRSNIFSSIFAVIILLALVGCGGGGGDTPSPIVTIPTATVLPAGSATINGSTSIVISFGTTMNPAMLVLSGTLAGVSDGGVWSVTSNLNDTLTISPTGSWTNGAQTLIINVNDAEGTALATLTLNYTVDVTLPVASVLPGSSSRITNSESIVITFTESVATTTLVASGTLWTNGDGGTWSATTFANDTLTLGPTSSWPAGATGLTLDIDDLVGNSLATLNLAYTVDVITPIGTPSPVNGLTLYDTDNIVISYDESMDSASHSYAGSLSTEIDSSIWSTDVNANDTLTIDPSSAWSIGTQTVDVTANDVAGNATTINLSYTVMTANCNDGIKNQDETDVDCGGSTCSTCATGLSCINNADCNSTSCTLGVCKELNGQTCGASEQCSSNFCIDSLCCSTACTGTCQSCAETGSLGACSNYSSGTDPESECPGLSCAGYYFGWLGDSCYRRAGVTAGTASCDGSGNCRSAAVECSNSGRGSAAITCDSLCQDPNPSTCTGTTAGSCTNVNPGNQSCGFGLCMVTVAQCTNGSPNACTPNSSAAITEVCGNGIDDDCDGLTDEAGCV